MASRKQAAAKEKSAKAPAPKDTKAEESKGRKTQKLNVWLNPDQIEWLKEKGGPSETVRALIAEAMALDNLAKSVKKKVTKKKD